MPSNQFFVDWVTGDIITAAKLNQMKNDVQPFLGFTPVNRAGDTITGDLTVNGLTTLAGRTFRWASFVPSSGVGWYRIIAGVNVFGGRLDIYAEWNAQVSRITLEGHSAGSGQMGYFNATQVFHYAGGLISQIRWGQSGGFNAYLDIFVASVTNNNNTPINLYFWGNAWFGIQSTPPFNPSAGTTNLTSDISQNGLLYARYDHRDRFTVDAHLGGLSDTAMSAFFVLNLRRISITLPSGKRLFLRRLRSNISTTIVPRIYTEFASFDGPTGNGEVNVDVALSNVGTGQNFPIFFAVFNNTSSTQTLNSIAGYVAEFELR